METNYTEMRRSFLFFYFIFFVGIAGWGQAGLTKREKEILRCLVEGLSYKMIAGRCALTFETVKTYIKRIYEKLHVASNTEAVAKAISESLI